MTKHKKKLNELHSLGILPSVEEAAVIALDLLDTNKNLKKLTDREKALFVGAFQTCIHLLHIKVDTEEVISKTEEFISKIEGDKK